MQIIGEFTQDRHLFRVDLEQNSHAVRFDSEQVEIAIEQSETELVRRATEALTRLLGPMESLESQVLWTYCDRQDDRLANESIYDRRQKRPRLY